MNLLERLERARRIDELIRRRATGNPRRMARILGISEATLYRDIEQIRLLGGRVKYCRNRQTYWYENDFEWKFEKKL